MNPFQAMQAFSNPSNFLNLQLQSRMNQMARQNPQVFQKMQEMTSGKSEGDLKQTAMNLAQQQGIDLKQFASNFGIKI
jgi:hypothetical protein